MTNLYQHKRSSTPSAIPTASQLAVGEIAINLVDKKLFSKDESNTVFEIGGSTSNGVVTSAWVRVTSNTTMEAGTRYMGVVTSNADFTIEATSDTNDEYLVCNSFESTAYITVIVGGSRRFNRLENGDNLILAPGEVLGFVATSNTRFEIV